ncbi:hypothetical protein, partial [Pseudomonas putida]|uniref:hypothetical protein n=1 Tax=Pseudomonas putida TaxID=303 RepID=UPI0024E1002A
EESGRICHQGWESALLKTIESPTGVVLAVTKKPACPRQLDHSCKTSILNFFIKSRTTLFKSLPACYKLVKQ